MPSNGSIDFGRKIENVSEKCSPVSIAARFTRHPYVALNKQPQEHPCSTSS